jgi:hypothetical protein
MDKDALIWEIVRLQATRPRQIDDMKYVLDWLVKSANTLHEASIRALSKVD